MRHFGDRLVYGIMYLGGLRLDRARFDSFEEGKRKSLFIGLAILLAAFIASVMLWCFFRSALPDSPFHPLTLIIPPAFFALQLVVAAGISAKNKRGLFAQLVFGLCFSLIASLGFKEEMMRADAEYLQKQELKLKNAALEENVARSRQLGVSKDSQRSEKLADLRGKAEEWERLASAERNGIVTTSNREDIHYTSSGAVGDGNKGNYCRDQARAVRRELEALKAKLATEAQADAAETAVAESRAKHLREDEPPKTFLMKFIALSRLFASADRTVAYAAWAAFILISILVWLFEFLPFMLKYFNKPSCYDTMVSREDETFGKLTEAIHDNHAARLSALRAFDKEAYANLGEQAAMLSNEAYCYLTGDFRSFIPPPPPPPPVVVDAPEEIPAPQPEKTDEWYAEEEAFKEVLHKKQQEELQKAREEVEHQKRVNEVKSEQVKVKEIRADMKNKFGI